jgi:hypothetical protein
MSKKFAFLALFTLATLSFKTDLFGANAQGAARQKFFDAIYTPIQVFDKKSDDETIDTWYSRNLKTLQTEAFEALKATLGIKIIMEEPCAPEGPEFGIENRTGSKVTAEQIEKIKKHIAKLKTFKDKLGIKVPMRFVLSNETDGYSVCSRANCTVLLKQLKDEFFVQSQKREVFVYVCPSKINQNGHEVLAAAAHEFGHIQDDSVTKEGTFRDDFAFWELITKDKTAEKKAEALEARKKFYNITEFYQDIVSAQLYSPIAMRRALEIDYTNEKHNCKNKTCQSSNTKKATDCPDFHLEGEVYQYPSTEARVKFLEEYKNAKDKETKA